MVDHVPRRILFRNREFSPELNNSQLIGMDGSLPQDVSFQLQLLYDRNTCLYVGLWYKTWAIAATIPEIHVLSGQCPQEDHFAVAEKGNRMELLSVFLQPNV